MVSDKFVRFGRMAIEAVNALLRCLLYGEEQGLKTTAPGLLTDRLGWTPTVKSGEPMASDTLSAGCHALTEALVSGPMRPKAMRHF